MSDLYIGTLSVVIAMSVGFAFFATWNIIQNAVENGGMFTWRALGTFLYKITLTLLFCILGVAILPSLVESFV